MILLLQLLTFYWHLFTGSNYKKNIVKFFSGSDTYRFRAIVAYTNEVGLREVDFFSALQSFSNFFVGLFQKTLPPVPVPVLYTQ